MKHVGLKHEDRFTIAVVLKMDRLPTKEEMKAVAIRLKGTRQHDELTIWLRMPGMKSGTYGIVTFAPTGMTVETNDAALLGTRWDPTRQPR